MSRDLTITGYSTAMFSTWYFCDEMGILFDCGDGVCSGLVQKARKIKHVFISHADRDHLAGVLQFNQLNGRPGSQWIPIEPGFEIRVREDLAVSAIENRHVPPESGVTKSLSYRVETISRKLKPELVGKPGSEIAARRKQHGEEAISDISRSTQTDLFR